MKATAKAPANIAFIKYWGKRNAKLRLPMNSSISMNLSEIFTITSVEFNQKLKEDLVKIDGKVVSDKEKERVVKHIERIRRLAKVKLKAKVESRNNFPKGTGLASSASGFAALTLAASKAAGLNLTEEQLSILARIGSGSACRSVPSGFVEWKAGNTNESSYARSLYSPDYWSICDVIAIVGRKSKKVGSTEGHALVESSPFLKTRLSGMKKKVDEIKMAMKEKDFSKFGEILEEEAINMHLVMMTSKPALYYWTPETLKIMLKVIEWRNQGLESYFTIDAGPNVHIICREQNVNKVKAKLVRLAGVKQIIINHPAEGARIVKF
jgi:diphosphomevalonate decarboxylase